MELNNSQLDHIFDPLKVVDIKTLASVAGSLKNSRNKSKRAIGVFLERVNRMRTEEKSTSAKPEQKTSSKMLNKSGLKDLQE